MLSEAFAMLLKMKQRAVEIGRPGVAGTDTFITPSTYYRGSNGPADTITEGRQFIITKENADKVVTIIMRGDQIVDTDLGVLTITNVEEMYNESGKIMGFRLTTG